MSYASISLRRHRYLQREYLGNRSDTNINVRRSYIQDVQQWALTGAERLKKHAQILLQAASNPALLAEAYVELGLGRCSQVTSVNDIHGVEGMKEGLWPWFRALRDDVLRGTFRRSEYEVFQIPKPGKEGFRTIEVPDVDSRLLARNLVFLLTPLFEPQFHPLSFGFRPRRSTAHCLAAAGHLYRRKMRHVVACDLQDAFGTIPRGRLRQILCKQLHNSPVLPLIEELLDRSRTKGVPQGLSLSPICLNAYLNHFLDHWWQKECPGTVLVRYADDLAVFCESRHMASACFDLLNQRVLAMGMKVKESHDEALIDLDRGDSMQWLGFRVLRKKTQLGFQMAESAWCRVEHAIEEIAASHLEDPTDTGERVNCLLLQWLVAMAPGIEARQLGAVVDRFRQLADGHRLPTDEIDLELTEQAWQHGQRKLSEAGVEVQPWLPAVRKKRNVRNGNRFLDSMFC